jgi:ribosome assembly protein YihI (activator of Der GTPase)
MSAIKELISAWHRSGHTATLALDAEAELKELEHQAAKYAYLDILSLNALAERDQQYRAKCLEVSELIGESIERDRADAELLEAWDEWASSSGEEQWEDLRAALERWAAAKGGGK